MFHSASSSFGSTSRPTHLIEGEKAKPANCFTVGAAIEEGIKLSLGHPMTNGNPALILDEQSYVNRSNSQGKGCIYEVVDGVGIVRRAHIEKFSTSGTKKVAVLERLHVERSRYAVVHVQFGLQSGVNLRTGFEPLWSGVVRGTVAGYSHSESLVEMKEDESVDIFYPDGSVACVHYKGLTNLLGKKPQMLLPEDALKARLELVNSFFETASKKQDDKARCVQQDRMFHELASMLLHTKLFPEIRKEIVKSVGMHTKSVGGKLRGGVYSHFRNVLRSINDQTGYWWMVYDASTANPAAPKGSSGKPLEEKARKALRSQKDAQYRREMQSPKGSKSDNRRKSV